MVSPATADIFVSPTGKDSNTGTTRDQAVATLQRAAEAARDAHADVVRVSDGVYRGPLKLTDKDSGVHWLAEGENVRLSGGVTLDVWTPSSLGANVVQADVSWVPDVQDRHLFVGGVRARRTRYSSAAAAELFEGSEMTDDGFTLAAGASSATAWPGDGGGVEFVYPQSTSPWTEPRCAVATRNATHISMKQPCWRNLVHKACEQGAKGPPLLQARLSALSHRAHELPHKLPHKLPKPSEGSRTATFAPATLAPPTSRVASLEVSGLGAPLAGRGYVENVGGSSRMRPGEWAVGRSASGRPTTCYYALRAGEAAATVRGVLPTMPILLEVSERAADLTFEGWVFEHATWTRPGEGEGYVEQQSGCGPIGSDYDANSDCEHDAAWSAKPAGNVVVRDASNVSFVRCEFARLGGFGLELTRAANCTVHGCYFHDISGSAVIIGQFQEPRSAHLDAGNTVSHSIISRAAAEFSGAVGLSVGYTVGTILEHNDVSELSYGGISVGWGWARHACEGCTDAGANVVRYNRVHDYKRALNDGGGIYMLGPQRGSAVHGNYVYSQGTPTAGALYPDEGSAYSTWSANVLADLNGSKWLHLWTSSIHDVLVQGNYADTSAFLNEGTRCDMINNTVFLPGEPPPEARRIMEHAGVHRNHRPGPRSNEKVTYKQGAPDQQTTARTGEKTTDKVG